MGTLPRRLVGIFINQLAPMVILLVVLDPDGRLHPRALFLEQTLLSAPAQVQHMRSYNKH